MFVVSTVKVEPETSKAQLANHLAISERSAMILMRTTFVQTNAYAISRAIQRAGYRFHFYAPNTEYSEGNSFGFDCSHQVDPQARATLTHGPVPYCLVTLLFGIAPLRPDRCLECGYVSKISKEGLRSSFRK